jgi:hypothetical protein
MPRRPRPARGRRECHAAVAADLATLKALRGKGQAARAPAVAMR